MINKKKTQRIYREFGLQLWAKTPNTRRGRWVLSKTGWSPDGS